MENLKKQFDTDGFLYKRGFFTEVESLTLKTQIDRYISDIAPHLPEDMVFYEDSDDLTSIKQMFGMSDYDPFFGEMLWESEMNQLAQTLLGENVDRGFVEYFNKPPGIGKPTPPHQDCFYFMLTPPQALTFWIPLEDVDEENGCLRYVRGSHKKGMRMHGETQTLGFSQGIVDFGKAEDVENEEAVPAKIGDVLVHHGLTIHRADMNKSKTRSRKVLGMVYFGESAKEDIETKKAYQEKLRLERNTEKGN